MITVSKFKSIKSTKPSSEKSYISAQAFREYMSTWTHKVLIKKEDAEAFSMCKYRKGGSRKKEDIQHVTAIVLDLDDGNTGEMVGDAFHKLDNFMYSAYTSFSHSEEHFKGRIILPISKPVTVAEYEEGQLALRLAAYLGLNVDSCCASAAQLYYMPSKPPKAKGHAFEIRKSDVLFDIALLPAKPAKPSNHRSKGTDDSRLEIYQEIREVVTNAHKGVTPMSFGGFIYHYEAGVWVAESEGKLFVKGLIYQFKHKKSHYEALDMAKTMSTLWAVKELPASNPNMITLKNGTMNVATMTLEAHSPDHYNYSGMDFDYDETAQCPQWLKFLDDTFCLDRDKEEKIAFLQEWFGYLLIPDTRFHLMVWLYGGGANGKSIVTNMARELLGQHSVSSIPLGKLGDRFMVAESQGKLANIVDEIGSDGVMHDDVLKKIVSGDPLQAERKNQPPFSFTPTARIFAATNALPQSKDSSHGLDRRLTILTFNRTLSPEEMDRDLPSKLKTELPGIFVWALNGLKRLQAADKFTEVPSAIEAVNEFKESRNSASLFKRDCLEVPNVQDEDDKSCHISSSDLYPIYREYCVRNGYKSFGKDGFCKKLKAMNIEQRRSGAVGRYYVVKVVNREEPDFKNSDHSGTQHTKRIGRDDFDGEMEKEFT